jgi:serine/threonine-protein kinase PknG
VAERRFLAEVEHPNIVKIYNFVQHPDRRSGTLVGYIVMEYVGGRSLKELAVDRRRAGDGPLPLEQVIAYAIEILPALGYLHSRGLLYCDFKPDNVLQTEEQLKLIDLGAVRWMEDDQSPVYGTGGYQAAEIAEVGPSISSDLYTVARTMAVLSFDFKGYTGDLKHSLPDPGQVPLFTQHESYYRLLRRATDPDSDKRFESAEEMAEQLTGVLREVVAGTDGHPRPGASKQFTGERRAFGSDADARPVVSGNGAGPAHVRADPAAGPPPAPDSVSVADALPVPQVDLADPAAGFLATASAANAEELVKLLANAPQPTMEVRFRLARTRIEAGDLDGAASDLAELEAEDPFDWRVPWTKGLAALAGGRPDEAWVAFDQVWDLLPGELAPKLALAVCAECCGYPAVAARNYATVWSTDHGYASAAFGLARMLQAASDHRAAVAVLESVPSSSIHHVAAQIAAVRARTHGRPAHELTEADLTTAAARLDSLALDPGRREGLVVELLEAALAWVLAGGQGTSGQGGLFGLELNERSLRLGLERAYRTLARYARDVSERHALVDRANQVRPRTLV